MTQAFYSRRRIQAQQPRYALTLSDLAVPVALVPGILPLVNVGTVPIQPTGDGLAGVFPGSGTRLLRAKFGNAFTAQVGGFSIGYVLRFATTATTGTVGGLGSDVVSTNTAFWARLNGGVLETIVGGSNSNGSWSSTGVNVSDGKVHTLVIAVESMSNSSLSAQTRFIDGVRISDGAAVASAGYLTYTWACGGGYRRATDSTNFWAGKVTLVAPLLKSGKFDPEYLQRLSKNAWQIFRATDSRIWLPAANSSSLSAAASGADVASGSASLTTQVALAGIGVSTAGGTAMAGISIPLSAAGLSVSGGSANGTATVTISAAGLARAAGQAGLSASLLMQAAGAAQAAGNAALAAQLNALAAGAAQAGGAANLSGGAPGALSAAGSDTASGSAALAAQVALAGIGVSTAGGSATAGISIPLSAAGLSVAGGSTNGTATVTISATGLAQAAGQAGLSALILAQASGAALASGNASLATQLNALAAGAAQAGGAANLSGGAPGALSAAGSDTASGSAVLSVSVQLQATGSDTASGSASLTGGAPGQIGASGSDQAGGLATLNVSIELTAAGFVQAMGAGEFSVRVDLSALGSSAATGSAHLVDLGVAIISTARRVIVPSNFSRRTNVQTSFRSPAISRGFRSCR